MEVQVYLNQQAMIDNKSRFCARVVNPDVFDMNQFVRQMKAIFGENAVIKIIIV